MAKAENANNTLEFENTSPNRRAAVAAIAGCVAAASVPERPTKAEPTGIKATNRKEVAHA